ncbi:hypothetical protein [Candidatus Electrothrix sp.]|uniref:hypothetical protein n=1 Tax=Candidatus Electrothrix sp. TaxID=2170559 RepID=UPI004056F68C
MRDEIIDEVRTMREAHAEKFNFDLDAIYEDIKRSEKEHIARGAEFIDPPPVTPGIPHSAYQKIRFASHSGKTAP